MEGTMRILLPLPSLLHKLFADSLGAKGLGAAAAVIVEYLLPVQGSRDMAIAAGALLVLDTLTGAWAAFVSGRKVSSAKFARVVSKVFGYFSCLVVCAVAMRTVPGASGLLPTAIAVVLGFIIATEGISILENVGRMGVKTPPFLTKWLRDRLKDKPEETV
jgi:toxin secretion/phage lysis holin